MKFSDVHKAISDMSIYKKDLNIRYEELVSLEGCPKEINGNFNCKNNNLTSLEGSPKKVDGNYYCSNNKITSLKGVPKEIIKDFLCSFNNLENLEYCPEKIGGNFSCGNNQLTSLKGSPKEINGDFYCNKNLLKDLKYCPKLIKGRFNCSSNPELKNIKDQIIKYQIKANTYEIGGGNIFTFKDIEKEFEEYRKYLLKKEELKRKKELLDINKKKLNKNDYGLGI